MITYVVCPHFYAFNNFMQKFKFTKNYETKRKNQLLNNFISFIFAQKQFEKNTYIKIQLNMHERLCYLYLVNISKCQVH